MATTDKTSYGTKAKELKILSENSLLPERYLIVPSIFLVRIIILNIFFWDVIIYPNV